MRNFRDLNVWHKAHEFTVAVYGATRLYPKDELYGLTSQIRRSSVSIEANIAEGCGRRSDAELARFLRIAMGSATETECHLLIARDLGFISAERCGGQEAQLDEIKRMLHSLLEKIAKDVATERPSNRRVSSN